MSQQPDGSTLRQINSAVRGHGIIDSDVAITGGITAQGTLDADWDALYGGKNGGRGPLISNRLIVSEGPATLRNVHRLGGTLIAPNGITMSGTTTGNFTVEGDVIIDGSMNPGLSPGTVRVLGDLLMTSGSELVLEVAGTEPSLMDQLIVTGDLASAGTLEARFINGFAPREGDIFSLISSGSISSTGFDRIIVSGLESGFEYNADLRHTGMILTALNDGSSIPGRSAAGLLALGALLALGGRGRKEAGVLCRNPRHP